MLFDLNQSRNNEIILQSVNIYFDCMTYIRYKLHYKIKKNVYKHLKQFFCAVLSVVKHTLGSVDIDLCIFAAFVGILCKAESMRCSYAT